MENLALTTPMERREMLSNVLLESEEMAAVEKIDGDLFSLDRPGARKKRPGAKRTAGMLADFSGGQNMAYVEYNKSKNKDLKPGKGNALMRKLRRENERKRAAGF